MNRQVSVGIVGAGYWGKNLVRNFAAIPGATLRYVCDLDAARHELVRSSHPSVRLTRRFEDLLEDDELQAVVVATPAESHRAVAEACLRAGKDVFVEKPIATTIEDAQALIAAAAYSDSILMVGHLFLYDGAVQALIRLVRNGKVGTVRYVDVVRTSMGGTARLDTSILWDALIHDAYLLPQLFNKAPLRVRAQGWGYLSALEDVVYATFDFGNSQIAHCYDSWYALEKARRITVVGSDGILHLDEFRNPKLVFLNRKYSQSEDRDHLGRHRWVWTDDGQEPQVIDAVESLRAECEHFIECVATRRHPRSSGNDGLAAVRIIDASARSKASDGAWKSVESSMDGA